MCPGLLLASSHPRILRSGNKRWSNRSSGTSPTSIGRMWISSSSKSKWVDKVGIWTQWSGGLPTSAIWASTTWWRCWWRSASRSFMPIYDSCIYIMGDEYLVFFLIWNNYENYKVINQRQYQPPWLPSHPQRSHQGNQKAYQGHDLTTKICQSQKTSRGCISL